MKIYTRVVWQWQPDGSLKEIESDSFDYEGPIDYCKSSPSPPPAPDYAGAAQATAQSQRVSQYTPFGSNVYSEAHQLDPITGQPMIRSDITLAPQAQDALNSQLGISSGLGNLAISQLPGVQQQYSQPMDLSSVPEIANQAYSTLTSRLDPQWNARAQQEQTQLANQGLVPGGEAYDNAMRDFNQGRNDAYQQANLAAISTMPQTYSLAQQTYQEPLNILNAIRTGAQVQSPQFSPNSGGANMLGAAQALGQYNQGLYSADVARTNAANQMTGQLGTDAILGAMLIA